MTSPFDARRTDVRRRSTCAALALACTAAAWPAWAADAAVSLPPPREGGTPLPATAAASSETAVLAGGCFWGVQGVFQHVQGVTRAVSGYAGGAAATASYPQVGSGDTGHAEAVRITFDPRQISFGQILQIYFSVAHNPTQLNRQGPDTGTQYRSTVFAENAEQARIASAYLAQLAQARSFDAKIVTTIELHKPFFEAESYHQDYLTRHPNQPYIAINDLPKVQNLKRLFPGRYRDEPVLVNARA